MRLLDRNKQAVYYAVLTGFTDATDALGNLTGEKVKTYSTPVKTRMYVSAARGSASDEVFGVDTPYTKVLITDDMSCPITETSRLWVGIEPVVGQTENEHNYIVTQVAKSLNHISYAVKEVDING